MKSHRSLIFSILVSALATLPTSAAGQELLFHWGNVEGNQELLTLGGYPSDRNPADRLSSDGCCTSFTEPLYQKVRQWYVNANKHDLAGPGFYVSNDLLDSRTYGQDLLIVKIEPINGASADQIIADTSSSSSLKSRGDNALDLNNFSELPLITKYTDSYYILSRPPTPDEARAFKITLQPPTAEHIDLIWKHFTQDKSQEQIMTFLSDIAYQFLNERISTPSPRAQILFERLLFDRGSEYLASPLPLSFLLPANRKKGDSFKRAMQFDETRAILRAYKAMRPSDPLTLQLFRNWMDAVRQHPQALLLSADAVHLLAEALPVLPETERLEHADWLLRAIRMLGAPNYFEDALKLFNALPSNTPAPIREAWSAELQRTLKKGRFTFDDSNRVFPLLEKQFGPEAALAAIRQDHQNFINSDWSALGTGVDDNAIEKFTEKTLYLMRLTRSHHPDQLEWIIETGMAGANRERSRIVDTIKAHLPWPTRGPIPEALRNAPLYAALLFIHETTDPVIRRRLVDYLKHQIQIYDSKETTIRSFGPFFKGLFAQNWSAEQFENFIRDILHNFPDLAPHVRLGLDGALARPYTSKPVAWTRLISEADQIIGDRGLDFKITLLYQQLMADVPPWRKLSIDVPAYREAVKRSLENIPGSRPYSELSRVFTLIDPLLISEDLRIMGAHAPQHRLDKPDDIDGQAVTRTSWNAFTNAWETFASELHKQHLDTFFPFYLDDAIARLSPIDFFLPLMSPTSLSSQTLNDHIYSTSDPIQRATAILRLPPFSSFGHERLKRLWAALELVQAGYPMPIGLPHSTSGMDEQHVELEVRKAVHLGTFWEAMIKDAQTQGISTDDFFQKVFRGSALEGLLHIDPTETVELEQHVRWLETLDTPPAWAKTFAAQVETEISRLRQKYGSIADTPQTERSSALDALWKQFQTEHAADIDLTPRQVSAPDLQPKPLPTRNGFCRTLLGKMLRRLP